MALLNRNNVILLVFKREFITGNTMLSRREGRFMKKLMTGSAHKKKWQSNSTVQLSVITPAINLAKGAYEGKQSVNTRRVSVLNKLFMRYITDLMATGESASEFVGKGLEINRVMVTPDFMSVNVFWIAKGTENDEKLEALLVKNAGVLRHELSQLRVMGVVPRIHFVKDNEYAKLMEVDLRLAKADFGEDYVPVEPSYKFKTEYCLNTPLSQHLKEKIKVLESKDTEEFEEVLLPPMQMNILGLNHSQIINKIQQSMRKSQALHRRNNDSSTVHNLTDTFNDNPVEFESIKKQREAFQEFLLKRQILREKLYKEKNKLYSEYEYLDTADDTVLEDSSIADEFLKTENDFIEENEDNIKF